MLIDSPHNPRKRLPGSGALTVALLLVAVGCVDKEKCDEAISVTRDSLAKEQTDLARQWRERAWKICDDATMVGSLDQEIVAKEQEIAQRAADEAAAAAKKVADGAQARMKQAGEVWIAYDKLDDPKKTLERLEKMRGKADLMKKDLPSEYAKQIDDYNQVEFDKRKERLKQ